MSTMEYDASKRSKGWCFTINNYDEIIIHQLKQMVCQYLVFGREVAPSTGTPHVQGYIHYVDQKSWSCMKKKFFPEIQPAIFPAKGTAEQSRTYCSKEDPAFFEKGSLPASQIEKGKRGTDKIKAQWELAKAGKFELLPPTAIKTYEYIHAKYGIQHSDRAVLDNRWIWGESGVGKSKFVRDTYSIFYTKSMSKWWDGYDGEDVVVLDDFAPEHAKFLSYYLKIWADHYVFRAEVKGGMLRIRPKTFIVTSQYPMERCWPDEPETLSALRRRFEVVNLVGSEAERVARAANARTLGGVDVGAVYADGFEPLGRTGFGVAVERADR